MKKKFKKISTIKAFTFDNYGEHSHYEIGSEGILCDDGEVSFDDGNKFHVPYEFFKLVDDQPYVEIIEKPSETSEEGDED